MILKWWFKIQKVIFYLIDNWIGNIVWLVISGRFDKNFSKCLLRKIPSSVSIQKESIKFLEILYQKVIFVKWYSLRMPRLKHWMPLRMTWSKKRVHESIIYTNDTIIWPQNVLSLSDSRMMVWLFELRYYAIHTTNHLGPTNLPHNQKAKTKHTFFIL